MKNTYELCPICNGLVVYNAYFDRYICQKCEKLFKLCSDCGGFMSFDAESNKYKCHHCEKKNSALDNNAGFKKYIEYSQFRDSIQRFLEAGLSRETILTVTKQTIDKLEEEGISKV